MSLIHLWSTKVKGGCIFPHEFLVASLSHILGKIFLFGGAFSIAWDVRGIMNFDKCPDCSSKAASSIEYLEGAPEKFGYVIWWCYVCKWKGVYETLK